MASSKFPPSGGSIATLRERIAELVDGTRLQQWRGLGVVMFVVVLCGAWALNRSAEPTIPAPVPKSASVATTVSSASAIADMVVQAAGAVVGPGVYKLSSGARVADVVEVAGGATAEADIDRVNLAAKVTDGQRVYIPRKGEASSAEISGSSPDAEQIVDINTATEQQLDALPGVGPATARAIVEHRARHGPFRSVDDLAKVKGIGPAKLAELRDRAGVS